LATHVLTEHLQTWDQVRAKTVFPGLLVGNGASLAVWNGFNYKSLFNIASQVNKTSKLSEADLALFDALDTNNFEYVLAALATARLVTGALGIDVPTLLDRYTSVKNALVDAVQGTHVPWANIPENTRVAIRSELINYRIVYSTNYDLLVYWAMMQNIEGFKDLFWGDYFDITNTDVWDKSTLVLYLHGGLHLYRTVSGKTRKRHAEDGANLLDLFAMPFDDAEEATPLFVSEGSAQEKLTSIHRSDYLAFAYARLGRHEGPLCIFGHSLDDLDNHIVEALKQAKVNDIAISVHPGSPDAVIAAQANAAKKLSEANLFFYDASTHPLGASGLQIAH
jgi:Domain of unknown function (DUF4917)